ncbi:sushi, von Willebrand factor type A, EGF and pentraxin domain-containing protein 1 isoform X2 [Nelusetta ayraudi]|uniref:sushi, von Willebrand factor type A, EGF and pentraxin domain-containing protein 1 isoform X2 n=1 Tax=Nelusetta ayraudi TaxID=303726 RepID=UPI003F7007D2
MKRSKETMLTFLLFLVLKGVLCEDPFDVCSTCHTDATCDQKAGGSEKECNCKFGFVGNGRSFCQDKDECQLGAKICGPHTACHNTYGSYYCTCSAGYSPSNDMDVFIPNDGTSCQDVDECSTDAPCGGGAQCRNLRGSFDCSCMLGYRVHGGVEPFHPTTDGASCRVVDCGPPGPVNLAVLLSVAETSYGGVATFACDKGFVQKEGDSSSVCGADGLWTPPTMVCEDVDECSMASPCGGGAQCRNLQGSFDCSCMLGYRVHGGVEPFHPTTDGVSCRVVDCGRPGPVNLAVLLSVTETLYGGVATFACDKGFVQREGDSSSVCGADGLWTPPTMVCEEVDCGPPPEVPHARVVWSSLGGTEVRYGCNHGYRNVGRTNGSVCGADGRWEEPELLCQGTMSIHTFYLSCWGSGPSWSLVLEAPAPGDLLVLGAATETSCGLPPVLEATRRLWDGRSSPGSAAFYSCQEGFSEAGGQNQSVCGEDAQWSGPSLSCREKSCGDPPTPPHAGRVWTGTSTPGTTVSYYCKEGFYSSGGHHGSVCTAEGLWTDVSITCRAAGCGVPPPLPHAVPLWDGDSTVGSRVVYRCARGYRSAANASVCTAGGKWDVASVLCEEISCGEPIAIANANMIWDGTALAGSQVSYLCREGFGARSRGSSSVCRGDGRWDGVDLRCEEVTCGHPPSCPHTRLQWDTSSGLGSVALYECVGGFYQQGGANVSTCLQSGLWTNVSVQCKAECGPAPRPAHSEVVRHNSSVAVHRCVPGYDHQGGSNTSVCQDSGQWQEATLTCAEAAPPISQLEVQHGRCLQWRADRKQTEPRVYQVAYSGSRDFQASFHHRGRESVSSREELVELCLDLQPLTNYSVSVSVLSPHYTSTVSTCTPLTAPPTPHVSYAEVDSLLPTLRLRRSADTLERISVYQVFVLPVVGTVLFHCSRPPPLQHLAAQLDLRRVGTEVNFTVGDGRYYGGAFNAPLETGRSYYVVLRAVRRWRAESKSSCVLWAKVLGPFFALTVASLGAAASVALLLLLSTAGYGLTRYKRPRGSGASA